MTIAATYPAAVIGMSLLKAMKGSLLEENMARTVGSIGESVAAGAVFTIPAFVMAGIWKDGMSKDHYWTSVALMVIGGLLGILFVTLLRRVMVEDPELPFPESVAASEIHKAGQVRKLPKSSSPTWALADFSTSSASSTFSTQAMCSP
jgi:putative OPT family oligopeptide transporter